MSTTSSGADPVVADRIVQALLAAPPTLGAGRLLCIDGPAGSGKTTLAGAVGALLPGGLTWTVVHLDDVYPGWDGLAEGVRRVATGVVEPLARSRPGGYRRYDWHAGREGPWCRVDPCDVLVLEGVGSGDASYQDSIGLLVWVEAPAEERLRRGLARDGDAVRPHWERWVVAESRHHARQRTRERADLVVST